MARMEGPLVFAADGTSAALAEFTNVAAFAAMVNWPLTLVRLHDKDSPPVGDEWVSRAFATLPAESPAPIVVTLSSDALVDALDRGGAAPGGVLAMSRTRRSLGAFLPNREFARLLRGCAAPVLMLPQRATHRAVKRILFPADLGPRSVAAFDKAVELCQTLQAELHVLHVFGDDRLLPNEMDPRRATARSPRELLDIDRAAIRGLVERATNHGVVAQAHTAEGRAHRHIVSYAAGAEIDLVVMPSHGPRSVEDMVVGTTTERVVRNSAVPVMAIQSRAVRAGVSTTA